MAISNQLERIISILDELNGEKTKGYSLNIEEGVYYISERLQKLVDNGFGNLPTHIETNVEYDSDTGYPLISNPEKDQFYLVPAVESEEGNMFDIWVYVGEDKWERFDAGGKIVIPPQSQADWNETNSSSESFIKNKPSIKAGSGTSSIAEGLDTTASGASSHAEGDNTKASEDASHAEGNGTEASGDYSHAEGYRTKASEKASHAEGYATRASGQYSHAEGDNTKATNRASHAEGSGTEASGQYSHAEGWGSKASGSYSHVEGDHTEASGQYSHAEGSYTVANHLVQHVFGRSNIADTSSQQASATGNYIEIVGNGDDMGFSRSNARTLDWSGNERIAGTLSQSSDKQLKDEYGEVPNVSTVKARAFKWNDKKPNHDNKVHIGYFAQDVEVVAPYLVDTDDMGYKALDYIGFLVAKIASLENRLEQIESNLSTN